MNFQDLIKKMSDLEQPVSEENKADKDYDGDGEVESEKDEVWGSRMKAAAKSGKMDEGAEETQFWKVEWWEEEPSGREYSRDVVVKADSAEAAIEKAKGMANRGYGFKAFTYRKSANENTMHPGYDPDYSGNFTNEIEELEYLLTKSALSSEEAVRKVVLAKKYGLNTPADLAKLPQIKAQTLQDITGRQDQIRDQRQRDLDQHYQNQEREINLMKMRQNAGIKEEIVDECGMAGPMEAPKQQDSVTMNVSMNGSGKGGIRDLLDVLRNIEQSSASEPEMGIDMDMDVGPDDGEDMLLKKKIDSMADMIDDDFANSAPGDEGPKMGGLDMVKHDGDDLHKKKSANPKANGGDNAMKLKDGATYKLPKGDIQVKLESLYQDIKLREGSGPKEKQHSKYVDRNSAESKAKVQAAKDKMVADKKANPGKKLLAKIKTK